MRKLYFYFFLFISVTGFAQTNYSGNGNTGFGDVIGNSNLNINDDGTTITFTLTKGTGDFNDALVLYISTGQPGRTVIDSNVEDNMDPLRRAISNGNDQGNGTIINFPPAFQADYAIGLEVGFAGLWSIPAPPTVVGDGGLPFVASANTDLIGASQAVCTFSVTWADLGLTNTDSFDFVGLYLNPGNAFSSNEGYGDGLPGANPGGGTITYTSFYTYTAFLSLEEFSLDMAVRFVDNMLQINNYSGPAKIETFDLLGRRLLSRNYQVNGQSNIDLNLPPNQVSIISVETGNGKSVIRAVGKY